MRKRTLFLLPFLLGFNLSAQAGTRLSDEQTALTRLSHEIAALQPLIDEARQAGPAHGRIRFGYTALENDLALIRAGIQRYLSTPDTEPRKIEPLRGDYIR